MAIYADRKQGKPTGRWRVEVQKDGGRARGRFDTYEDAKKAESQWLIQFPKDAKPREDKRGVPKRLKDLVERTEGNLWKGKDSREISEGRLARMVALCGPQTLLEDLNTPKLDDAVTALSATGIKGTTIDKYLSSLHKLLSWGKDRRWVKEIPVFPWQDEDSGRIRWITPEEEPKLLALVSPECAATIRVAIATGMRRGEILSLEREQVEPNWVRLWKTKTKTPRSVPIGPQTYEDLCWLLDVGMPTEHALRYQWDKAKVEMGLALDEWFTFHCCRHTCATRLVQANVNLRIVQKWLGHKRIETTIRYAQVNDTMLSDAFAQVEVFQHGVLDTSPTVGYRGATDLAKVRPNNRLANSGAIHGPLPRPIVEKWSETCAGVVKLADTQDLGSCGASCDLNDITEVGEDPKGD